MRQMLETWEQWRTQFTEFTCARCAALDGALFRKGEGPRPPLHEHCRCRRVFHHQVLIDVPIVLDVGDEDDEPENENR